MSRWVPIGALLALLALPVLVDAGYARRHGRGYQGTGPGGEAVANIDMGAKSLTFDDKLDYIVGGTNTITVYTNSDSKLEFSPGAVTLKEELDTSIWWVYSSTAALDLGATGAPASIADASGNIFLNGQAEAGSAFVLKKVTSDPCAGGAYPIGSIFYNSTSNYACYCGAANADLKVSDNAACF